jgi:UDP-N-acetylmuramoyl-tripeptide--D-alanyl-D-alanine ligase
MLTTESLHAKFVECSSIGTDTRSVQPGSLFFALKGPNFNANAFAAEALAKGAKYVVVDDHAVIQDERFLFVPDVLHALQNLARYHRRLFDIPVIGITGSNGKTTTKELMHAVLASDRETLATSGNLNNHIGVPLTLLGLKALHRIAIVEMGANKPGDIAELAAIAEPTHGLITNIGKAHLEGFGNFDGVVRTKTELYQAVRLRNGLLFVNADDPLLMEKSSGAQRKTYGRTPWADTTGKMHGQGAFLGVMFQGKGNRDHFAQTCLVGAYNLPNALAAIAIGQHFGVPDARIAKALADYQPGNNRSQFSDTGRNQLIQDAYNANPTSMAAALENFATIVSDRPKVAILGDMLELGTETEKEHARILELVRRLGMEARFVGSAFALAASGSRYRSYANAQELYAALTDEPISGTLILLKGSRGIKLETVLPSL